MFGDGVLSELPLLIFLEGGKVGKGTHGYFYPQVVDTILRFSFWFKGWDLPSPCPFEELGLPAWEASLPRPTLSWRVVEKLITFLGFFRGGGVRNWRHVHLMLWWTNNGINNMYINSLPIIQWEKNEKWWRIFTWQMLMIFGIIKSVAFWDARTFWRDPWCSFQLKI